MKNLVCENIYKWRDTKKTDLTDRNIHYGVFNVSDGWGHALSNESHLRSPKHFFFCGKLRFESKTASKKQNICKSGPLQFPLYSKAFCGLAARPGVWTGRYGIIVSGKGRQKICLFRGHILIARKFERA